MTKIKDDQAKNPLPRWFPLGPGTHADVVLQLRQQLKVLFPGTRHLRGDPGPHLGWNAWQNPSFKSTANTRVKLSPV